MATALIAFKGTIAQKVMVLCGIDGFVVSSSQKSIGKLVGCGVLDFYDSIVAMGLKNRSKDSYVHVEKLCLERGSVMALDTSLEDGKLFRQTIMPLSLEKSWCNMLAVALKNKYPNKKIAFLHIPPGVDAAKVAKSLMTRFDTWE